MFTFMARFALVHFLHEAVYVHDPGLKVIFISFSASYELFKCVCWLLFLVTNLTDPNAQKFPLERSAKQNVTYPKSLRFC